ncbi:hypothetical protein CIRMBP1257_00489 [Enterococcus cecorum]|nr:hypothetical protein CIRMBP1257_00489 [Enterococcus cecorum]
MSDNKKYYYMKLKEDFFDTEEMIVLEGIQDGYIYSNILLKLYLKSLKTNGRLMLRDLIPYNAEMIANITRHNVSSVKVALDIFKKLGLIEVLDDGAIYMKDIQNFVGSSSSEADRKRAYRLKIKEEKERLENNDFEQDLLDFSENLSEESGTNVRTNVHQRIENRVQSIESRNLDSIPNLDINKNLDSNTNKENILSGTPDFVFPKWLNKKSIKEIQKGNPKNYEQRIPIAYLNQKLGKSYKYVDKNTKLVNARLKEGYTIDDFKTVIDKKVTEWQNGDMAKYLRPETLFGTKFDGYLNQPIAKKQGYVYEDDLPF